MVEKVSVPSNEQEVTINYMPADGKNCEVYSSVPWFSKFIVDLVTKNPHLGHIVKDDKYGVTVSLQFRCVKPRVPRTMTPEQKAKAVERLHPST